MNGIRLASLLLLLLGLAAGAHAQRLAPMDAPAAQSAQAPLHSFADLFRIATSAASVGEPLVPGAPATFGATTFVIDLPAAQPAMRVANAAPQAAGYVFSIGSTREPQTGLLLLAGLAAALWVARRRLMHSY